MGGKQWIFPRGEKMMKYRFILLRKPCLQKKFDRKTSSFKIQPPLPTRMYVTQTHLVRNVSFGVDITHSGVSSRKNQWSATETRYVQTVATFAWSESHSNSASSTHLGFCVAKYCCWPSYFFVDGRRRPIPLNWLSLLFSVPDPFPSASAQEAVAPPNAGTSSLSDQSA